MSVTSVSSIYKQTHQCYITYHRGRRVHEQPGTPGGNDGNWTTGELRRNSGAFLIKIYAQLDCRIDILLGIHDEGGGIDFQA